ncbi:MAG: methionine ABC transporter ATP-binding protein [Candidatus Sedimenticola endophacoides]|nr:MAG: methionine ABC transporter ATP-binding protein [Candidatus Sedimenticola endophacoides]OQX46900.1 MAG: methionine ABC transporter ATP-binding protein [Candidatus Sedimenticola endophacoides]OQX48722.1 MAG: methionine ABC transporter ATP-binding protein [Candidatus Sedimenticola endophacoides]
MPASDRIVDIRGLSFRWQPQAPIVLALDSLSIEKGERVFIEGPSGSGKSTLLSLLAGISVPQQGELRVLNQQLDQLGGVQRDHFRAHHIGYIFQMFNLIPYLSMVDNVVLPCRFSKARHDRALQRSQTLEAEAMRLLEHLDMAHADLLHRTVTALSVGQQQRVAAARALMGAPELLIADEPTSSLDADRREAFVRLLFQECKQAGSTLVFVSHDASLEGLFDRTIRLAEFNTAGVEPAQVG